MSLQRTIRETVFNGRDNILALNWSFRQIRTQDEFPLDFSEVTRVVVNLKGYGDIVDTTDVHMGQNINISRGNGWIDMVLGTLGVPADSYLCRIYVFRGAGDSIGTQIAHEAQALQQVVMEFVD